MHPAKLLLATVAASATLIPALAQGQPAGNGERQPYQYPSGQYPSGQYPPGYEQAAPGCGQGQAAPGSAYGNYMPPAGQPGYGGNQPAPYAMRQSAPAMRSMSVSQWFRSYDQIRHQAQMSASERQRADALLSRGVSILMPGDEKEATRKLLVAMVMRYQRACQQLKQLPQINQTAYLHHAYYNYFATAQQLFSDYLRVEDNLFTADATTGQPLATSLLQRKQSLEAFEHECKQIDQQVRRQFGIAPYPW